MKDEAPEQYRCKACGKIEKNFTVYCTVPGCHGRMYVHVDGHEDQQPKNVKQLRREDRER